MYSIFNNNIIATNYVINYVQFEKILATFIDSKAFDT